MTDQRDVRTGRSCWTVLYEGFEGLVAIPGTAEERRPVDDGETVGAPIRRPFLRGRQYQCPGTIRPALGIQLRAASGQEMVASSIIGSAAGAGTMQDRREQQAIQMNAFAVDTPNVPIISGGDFNIPLHSVGQTRDAFRTLTQRWEYREPDQPNVGTSPSGSVLDAVFVTNRVQGWESSTTILRRAGHAAATTRRFRDTN